MFIFTHSALRFPLGVCINMAEVTIGCRGLYFSGQYLYCGQACKCAYWFQPCWDSYWAYNFTILLLYMIIVTEHICIFIDCTYIKIVTEHASRIYWDRVNTATGRMYIFLNFNGIETATSVWVYISRTILILSLAYVLRKPLGLCIYNFRDRINIAAGRIQWDSHWAWVYISRDCIKITTGRVYWSSHWVYRFAFTGTVLILPLGIKCVYIDFNCIGIATVWLLSLSVFVYLLIVHVLRLSPSI